VNLKCDIGCFWSDFVAAGFMCVGLILFTLADSQVKYFFVNFEYKILFKFLLFIFIPKSLIKSNSTRYPNFPSFHKIYVPISNEQGSGKYF
jgi:hypothetical protein